MASESMSFQSWRRFFRLLALCFLASFTYSYALNSKQDSRFSRLIKSNVLPGL